MDLVFDNAASRLGLVSPATYQAQWRALDNVSGDQRAVGAETDLADPRLALAGAAWGPADHAGFRYATASIRTTHAQFPHWASPVLVTVRERNGQVDVVGIERPAKTSRTGGDGSR